MSRRIYVESTVAAPVADVWARTQDVADHVRWDLRFGRIETEAGRAGERQRFVYATAGIAGTGESIGERRRPDGSATSALRFHCDHPLSVIADGAGYWRYVPVRGGTRFMTGYDYTPRYPGLDRLFRPLMGWATAWSFDRLRLWLERGTSPERSLLLAVLDVGWRTAAVVVAVALVTPLLALPAIVAALLVPVPSGVPSGRRPLRRPPDAAAERRERVEVAP